MGSVGHVVVGAAIAAIHGAGVAATPRQTVLRFLWFPALAMVPDLDVVGFKFGVAYADEWGHRGASHSIVFAVALGLFLSLPTAKGLGAKLLPTAIAVVAALVSHGLIDSLTDGGLGPALFWPFDDDRHFAPWRPIPVAPIGRAFLSARGLHCAVVEIGVFLPLLIGAVFWNRRCRTVT